MKSETETLIRNVVSLDPEVAKENLERAIDIMRGKVESDEDLIHNIRFKDAQDLLKVSRRTLSYYIDHGYIDRVYGCGDRALGVSRESLLRFMNRRVVRRRNPAEKNLKVGRPAKQPGMSHTTTKERKISK